MDNQLKVYHVDEVTLFAAYSAEQAAELYEEWTGDAPGDGYPDEATDEFLDKEIPEFDENECQTGEMTTIRSWLSDAEPGFLASSEI